MEKVASYVTVNVGRSLFGAFVAITVKFFSGNDSLVVFVRFVYVRRVRDRSGGLGRGQTRFGYFREDSGEGGNFKIDRGKFQRYDFYLYIHLFITFFEYYIIMLYMMNFSL